MSTYSGFEVTISDIKIDTIGICKLKEVPEGHLSGYEDITPVYKEDYIRFYKVFNCKPENVLTTLKIVEKYLIKSEDVKCIGSIWDENESELEGKIYMYNGKIYIIYVTVHYNFGFPEDYKYTVKNTDDGVYDYNSSGETELKTLLDTYNSVREMKSIITNECSKASYTFIDGDQENMVVGTNIYSRRL